MKILHFWIGDHNDVATYVNTSRPTKVVHEAHQLEGYRADKIFFHIMPSFLLRPNAEVMEAMDRLKAFTPATQTIIYS